MEEKERYEYYKGTTEIFDNELDDIVEDVVDVLNQKDYNIIKLIKIKQFQSQRIAELEEQLKKKPKYNIGDRVYIINKDYEIERDFVKYIDIDTDGIEYYTEMCSICFDDCQLFKTKEEAEAKLKKLGENK